MIPRIEFETIVIHYTTANKKDKIDIASHLLNLLCIAYTSGNDGIHIHWKDQNYRFDLWPTTEKLWVTIEIEEGKIREIYEGASRLWNKIYEIKERLDNAE